MEDKESEIIKIIIVDDHQMFIDGLVSVLSSQDNMEVIFTENNAIKALENLKKLKKHHKPKDEDDHLVDLVITDVSMPEMNGLEFIKALKKDYPKIKILVISMFHNIQDTKNIHGFLLKETPAEDLVDAINGIVLFDEKYLNQAKNEEEKFKFKKNIVLSTREKDIIKLLAKDIKTEEISVMLDVSVNTIRFHKKNIFIKLNVTSIAGMVKMAIHLGVIDK